VDNNRRGHRRNTHIPPELPRFDCLPPTAWFTASPVDETERSIDSEHSIAELIGLVRATGGMVGGCGLWDPRHEDEVRRMLTTALEMEGVLPPGSAARLRR
jgi:hypothetical protein